MLKICIRHGMVVDKVHEVNSFRQSKWLKKYINFNTQKRNKAENEFDKDFYKLGKSAFYGKTVESVTNRVKKEFSRKDDNDKIINNNQN